MNKEIKENFERAIKLAEDALKRREPYPVNDRELDVRDALSRLLDLDIMKYIQMLEDNQKDAEEGGSRYCYNCDDGRLSRTCPVHERIRYGLQTLANACRKWKRPE